MALSRTYIAAAGVLTAATLTVVNASPAAATTVLAVGPGSLQAKGAVASVPITFTCDRAGDLIEFGLNAVTQVRGKRTATGSGGTSSTCTGQPQTETVAVVAAPSAARYKKGDASYVLTYSECTLDPYTGRCTSSGHGLQPGTLVLE